MADVSKRGGQPRSMPAMAWCSRGLGGEPLDLNTRFWVFVDTETTGLDPARHRLTEAAAVVLDADLALVTEHVWCEDDGDDALIGWANQVDPYLAGGVLVAHNLRFDLAFLEADGRLREQAVAAPARWLCTLNIGGGTGRRSLVHFAEAEGVEPEDPHTAIGDARTLARTVERVVRRARDRGLTTVAGIVVATPTQRSVPTQILLGEPWAAMLDALAHVVPVRPLSERDRRLVHTLFDLSDPGASDLGPVALDEAAAALRAAGTSRIAFARMLQEAGQAPPAFVDWCGDDRP